MLQYMGLHSDMTKQLTHIHYPAAAAKSLQSCPTLCDPIDGSPPGSPVPGILQAGEILVVPREKIQTGAAARGNP